MLVELTGLEEFVQAEHWKPLLWREDPREVPFVAFTETGSCFIKSPQGVFYERPSQGITEDFTIPSFIPNQLLALPTVGKSIAIQTFEGEQKGPIVSRLFVHRPYPGGRQEASINALKLIGSVRNGFAQIARSPMPFASGDRPRLRAQA